MKAKINYIEYERDNGCNAFGDYSHIFVLAVKLDEEIPCHLSYFGVGSKKAITQLNEQDFEKICKSIVFQKMKPSKSD